MARLQLFEGSATRQRFRAHDLRATFVTIALATGKTETWVSDRTGHDGHSMIERYRRKARTWNLGELGWLHDLIPELAEAEPTARIRPGLPLKITARVAKLADAADLGSQGTPLELPNVGEISPIGDPRPHEIAPEQPAEWQSSGNQKRLAELDAAIANVTRLLAESDDVGAAAELVGERRAMRLEREELRRTGVRPAEKQSSDVHEGFALPSVS